MQLNLILPTTAPTLYFLPPPCQINATASAEKQREGKPANMNGTVHPDLDKPDTWKLTAAGTCQPYALDPQSLMLWGRGEALKRQ
jgi:hypothetical protein